MADLSTKLRRETSMNFSGKLRRLSKIEHLKEAHYYVKNISLDGDAPKQFIRAYFFEQGGQVHKRNPRTWIPFIAKTAEKWYPHESVVEYMINCIGIELGINMNAVRLVKANRQIRFLSQYFLNSNQMLVHGAEICGQFIEDIEMAKEIAHDRKTARELFTFEFIEKALRSQFPKHADDILIEMVKMLTFDALVGNNDRHFYNWGIISNKRKTNTPPLFAPIYDTARALLWNISDENVLNMYRVHCEEGKKVVNYIRKASPRLSIEGNSKVNHFELISFIKEYNPIYKNVIGQISTEEKQFAATEMMKREFSQFFIPERNFLISFILNQRFEQIRSI